MKRIDHIRSNFLLAYPIMLGMLGQVMTGVADNVMVGWTGATPLAAASFGNTFYSILLFFCVGVSYAITPLVARATGAGDIKEANAVLRHGLMINVAIGAGVTVIIFALIPLMYHMGQPKAVVDLAIPYIGIIALAIIPTMVFQSFRQFCEGLHRTRMAMVVVIGSNLVNIVLNYLFIFGKGGFAEMGLYGAGLATFLARCLMGASMALYVYFDPIFRVYRPGFAIRRYSRELISRMLHIGLPAGAQYIFEAGAFGLSAIMMGWIGTVPLAAHQIALNLATISYMTTSGLGAAATIKVGHYLGSREPVLLRRSAYTMFWMAGGIMSCWALLFLAGRVFLPSLYIDDEQVLEVAATMMVIAAFFQISDGLQVVCAGALRGLQDVKVPTLLIFAAYWIIALPIGYVLAFHLEMGPAGIWIGLLTGLTLTAVAMLFRFHYLSRTERLPMIAEIPD